MISEGNCDFVNYLHSYRAEARGASRLKMTDVHRNFGSKNSRRDGWASQSDLMAVGSAGIIINQLY